MEMISRLKCNFLCNQEVDIYEYIIVYLYENLEIDVFFGGW